jgi:hypothetical protein
LRRLAVWALLLGLLVATTTAFGVAEALKLERSPLARVRLARALSPNCGCWHAQARLAFRLRRAEVLNAVVVDADGNPVRTLLEGSRRPRGLVKLRWDGRTDAGTVAPDGAYRLRISFPDEGRTITPARTVRVDSQPPQVELVSLAPRRLSPDGDGTGDVAAIVWRSDEAARPLVLVDGEVALRGRKTDAGTATVMWDGTQHGTQLPAGRYLVALAARDAAGNVSAPTRPIPIRIGYIDVRESVVRARGGLVRVHVRTDARRYDLEIFRRGHPGAPLVLSGPNEPGLAVVRLAPNMPPGRYVLRVTANGHHDDVSVIVGRRS